MAAIPNKGKPRFYARGKIEENVRVHALTADADKKPRACNKVFVCARQ